MKLTLFGMIGFPGSGKTYFSRKFSKDYNLFHLSSDYLRSELFKNPTYQPDEQKIVFGAMNFITESMLSKNVSLLYDANSTKLEYRKDLQNIAQKYNAQYYTLWFQSSVDLALERIGQRKELIDELEKRYHHPIEPEVMYSLKDEQENPIEGEPVIIINAALDYDEKKKEVLKVLQ